MIGDGINDLGAFKKADTAILTVQQAGDRPEELFRAADYVISHVGDVLPIIQALLKCPNTSRS
jgi:Cu+-exporting ATPase